MQGKTIIIILYFIAKYYINTKHAKTVSFLIETVLFSSKCSNNEMLNVFLQQKFGLWHLLLA